MSDKVIRFSPKSAIKSYEERSRAVICFVWSIVVSCKYNLYESPIQQSRDLMKSGFRVHARFIMQNDRPYSNGMGREAHVLVSRKIRMAGLSNSRLEYFCDLVGGGISH